MDNKYNSIQQSNSRLFVEGVRGIICTDASDAIGIPCHGSLLAVQAARRNTRGRNAIGDLQVQPDSPYIFAIVARGLYSKAEPPGHFARDGSLS
ncbi:MAG: hypothetical protein Q8L22_15445 [Reyranella sp.]|nr:hypothetical protein [Reyranella sp.]